VRVKIVFGVDDAAAVTGITADRFVTLLGIAFDFDGLVDVAAGCDKDVISKFMLSFTCASMSLVLAFLSSSVAIDFSISPVNVHKFA